MYVIGLRVGIKESVHGCLFTSVNMCAYVGPMHECVYRPSVCTSVCERVCVRAYVHVLLVSLDENVYNYACVCLFVCEFVCKCE